MRYVPVVTLLLAVFPAFVAAGNPLPVRICYESDPNPPYMTGTFAVPQDRKGILPEKVERAAKAAGLTVSFYRLAWQRCIRDLKENRADAIFAMIWTAERDTWAAFPKTADGQINHDLALQKVNYPVFQRTAHPVWDGATFHNVRQGIGAPIGYVAEGKLSQLGVLSGMKYTHREGLRQVALGRLDGYVVEENIGRHLLQTLDGVQDVQPSSPPFLVAHWHIPFSLGFYQRHGQSVEAFWQSLAR